jgi:SagB-type dehydrogenase family enzyme
MSMPQLSTVLTAASHPFAADFAASRLIQLYLYVHRVEGLDPGVYRHWADPNTLERLQSGDQRVAAAGLSLGQNLAGNACLAFSMIAGLDRATRAYGDRGYRYAHFEAGAIGQQMYIAAESMGLRCTGIGAFFDDRVHRYLELDPDWGQVIYHFAIGYPVIDPRLDA